MRYVVDDPSGESLTGVKDLTDYEAATVRQLGFKVTPYIDNRLTQAASAIWRQRTAEMDPMGDPSGDCGGAIREYERDVALRAVREAGYDTPGQYNEDLRSRMITDGNVSRRVYDLLSVLEIEDVCPRCGNALKLTSHWTRNYGGGWDTFTRCPVCDYAEVYV